jgi:hypothetical protein
VINLDTSNWWHRVRVFIKVPIHHTKPLTAASIHFKSRRVRAGCALRAGWANTAFWPRQARKCDCNYGSERATQTSGHCAHGSPCGQWSHTAWSITGNLASAEHYERAWSWRSWRSWQSRPMTVVTAGLESSPNSAWKAILITCTGPFNKTLSERSI